MRLLAAPVALFLLSACSAARSVGPPSTTLNGTLFQLYYLPRIRTVPSDFPLGPNGTTPAPNVSAVDDYNLERVALPFSFPFFGQRHDDIWLGANGIVQLANVSLGNATRFVTESVDMRGTILPFFADLYPGNLSAADGISYTIDATAGLLDIFYTAIPFYDCPEHSVSFTLRLSWTGRMQFYYRSVAGLRTGCASARNLAVVGVVPPARDPRLRVTSALVPEQTALAFNTSTETALFTPPWAGSVQGVFMERRMEVNDTAQSALLRVENAGIDVVEEDGFYWELCPVSASVCLAGASAEALPSAASAASADVSGSLTWTFAEFGCDPEALDVRCAFATGADVSEVSLYSNLTEGAPITVDLDDPTALFNRTLECAFPPGLRYDTDYNVTLVYRYTPGDADMEPIIGASPMPLRVASTGAVSAALSGTCDACGVADAATTNECFGDCDEVYSQFDCVGECLYETVVDSFGDCCNTTCIGACGTDACCRPGGCDGVCGSFATDDTCFGLAAAASVIAADVADLSFFDAQAEGGEGKSFQVTSEAGVGAAAVITLPGPIDVEIAEPVLAAAQDEAESFSATATVTYNISYGNRFELVTNAPVNITGPANISVHVEVLWPNATSEADLGELFTDSSVGIQVQQAGGYNALNKVVDIPFLVFLRGDLCDRLTQVQACAWAPGCFMCSLVRGGRRRVAPISKQRRLLDDGSPQHADPRDRRLSLGVFPEAIVASPGTETIASGLCFPGLDVSRCDEIILQLEGEDVDFDDARVEV